MLIDPFTVGAQVLNFLVLVWLMKRFLYTPVRDAIDARERRIASAIADADQTRADATREREEFQRRNEELDQQRATLLARAADEASAEGQRLLDGARQAADDLGTQRMVMLRREVHSMLLALGRRTEREVFAIARQTLTDLASTSLEAQMTEVFTRQVLAMDGESRAKLAACLQSAPEPATLRSAFELPAEQRALVQRALDDICACAVRIRFETAPALISGIALTTDGYTVAWTIADYLASLEKAVAEIVPDSETPAVVGPPSHTGAPRQEPASS